jgi:hypothetical protein|tara:strand:- start:6435 stop:6596 length:162 start_codon:yes stop_codon:yes gene_type:complete
MYFSLEPTCSDSQTLFNQARMKEIGILARVLIAAQSFAVPTQFGIDSINLLAS